VTRLLNLRTYAIIDLQRVQVQLNRIDGPFNAVFEERSDFKPDMNSSEDEIPIMKGGVRTQKVSSSPFLCRDLVLFRQGFQIEYN